MRFYFTDGNMKTYGHFYCHVILHGALAFVNCFALALNLSQIDPFYPSKLISQNNEPIPNEKDFFQYYEMSYGLNVEMHKQTEICKRLDAIIRQVLPFLSGEV